MRALACLSLLAGLLAAAACKTSTSVPDAGFHPRAPDGSVCDLGAVWLGDTCMVIDCSARADLTVCRRSDGDAGQCLAASCRASIDTASDPANCGGSGATCAVGATCAHGECFIDGGMIDDCTGVQCPAGEGCLYAFCAQLSCSGATSDELCLWGDGGGPGPWGHCCNGVCAYLATPENCGGCGVACPSGYVCAGATCQPIDACAAGDNQGTCGFADGGTGTCCNGTCVDLGGDAKHCGSCGETCPAESFCSGHVCRVDGGPSGPSLANCEDAGCPVGTLCSTGYSCRLESCDPSTNGDSCIAPAGLSDGTCCAGSCTDTVADPHNCGGCGISCASPEICVNNACAEPLDCSKVLTGPCAVDGGAYQGTCCEGHCVVNGYINSPAGDVDCGRCGAGCPTGTHCGLYLGTDPICFSDIDAGPAFPPPGCSAATCPADRGCTGQQCYPTDCTGLPAGATCAMGVDGVQGICCEGGCVSQDGATACGRCGAFCPPGSTCSEGSCNPACVASSCPAGSTCETASQVCLTTACGTLGDDAICAVPGLLAGEIRDGLCCGGACIDPLLDASNCGSCGAVCPTGVCSGDEGTCFEDTPQACLVSCGPEQLCSGASCLSAVCPYVVPIPCASVYGTVGMCCPDRACADLTIDPANCGQCGVACSASQACVAGVCG